MQPGQNPADTERQPPWAGIGWLIFFCMIVLMIAVNAMYRGVGNKAAIERERRREAAELRARQASRLP